MEYRTYSNELVIPIPCNLRDAFLLISSDYYRYYGKNGSFLNVLKALIINPSFAYCFFLRLSLVGGVKNIAKIFKVFLGRIHGIQISENTPIGFGLYIAHACGTIVNPSAIIGNNCTISQFSTVGAIEGRAAIIGNDVYIGPSTCIVENVIIGSNVIIGAGSVVVKNVKSFSIVAGVPAKFLSVNTKKNYIINPFPYEKYCICNKHS